MTALSHFMYIILHTFIRRYTDVKTFSESLFFFSFGILFVLTMSENIAPDCLKRVDRWNQLNSLIEVTVND